MKLKNPIIVDELRKFYLKNNWKHEEVQKYAREFGLKSKNSEFDQWCEKWGIKHIRSKVHKPTTTGKVERHHLTFINEIRFCGGDLELFRYRYNHIRPHRSLFMKTPAEVYFEVQIRIKVTEPQDKQRWWHILWT